MRRTREIPLITAAKAAAINTKAFFKNKIICHITIVEIKRKKTLLATRARDLPRTKKTIFILQKILHIIDVKEKTMRARAAPTRPC